MTKRFSRGDIVSYPYLWRWQNEEDPDREHGEKDRPTCLILTVVDANGLTHMLLLPISSKPPFEGQTGIEIPPLELRRANLGKYGRGWITVSEYNYDILEKSYYFQPGQSPIGRFSDPFMETLRQKFAPFLKGGSARVNRT